MKTIKMKPIRVTLMNLPAQQAAAAEEIAPELGLLLCSDGAPVRFAPGKTLSISRSGEEIHLTYPSIPALFRGLSLLHAYLTEGKSVDETPQYSTLCYMVDCSRNAVPNLPTARKLIRSLAAAGYTSMMLYTEDTYELPGYPYFGRQRGRYTAQELKAIDDYAASFGLELIPCIQTLAHLGSTLHWPANAPLRDVGDILLAGDERTYAFIDAMIGQCRACFRSERINIGMDEAHLLGRGEYLKKNGYRPAPEIILEHLSRVVSLCKKHGFQPMMWSDMFFRMAFGGEYYVKQGNIPEEVRKKVPAGVTLIYWDYYTTDAAKVDHMLKCHKEFDNPVAFAGGAWKWYGFGAHNGYSLGSSRIQLDGCAKYGVDQIIVTAWGDNGGEASQFSSMASVLYFAERCYGEPAEDPDWRNARAEAVFGIPFDDLVAFDLPDALEGVSPETYAKPVNPSKYLLYNDPLERLMDSHLDPATTSRSYQKAADRLAGLAGHPVFGYAFDTLEKLCRLLVGKSDLGIRIAAAYRADDRAALGAIAGEELPRLIGQLEDFIAAFRKQWYTENKPFGFSPSEIRLGGLRERLLSTGLRLETYLAGEIPSIPELDEELLPMIPSGDGKYVSFNRWFEITHACGS